MWLTNTLQHVLDTVCAYQSVTNVWLKCHSFLNKKRFLKFSVLHMWFSILINWSKFGKYTLLRFICYKIFFFNFLHLWKLLAKEWCCVRLKSVLKAKSYKSPQMSTYLIQKNKLEREKYHAQVFRKEQLSRAENKIKIINKTSSQCPPERLKIFSSRDCWFLYFTVHKYWEDHVHPYFMPCGDFGNLQFHSWFCD